MEASLCSTGAVMVGANPRQIAAGYSGAAAETELNAIL
jgi:hypothetical protein